jgi:RHS repeat-associated protein
LTTCARNGGAGAGFNYPFLTSKERDNETGLDYFLARYYSNVQGRFTSPDEFKGGPDEVFVLGSGDGEKQALPYAEIVAPQSLNKSNGGAASAYTTYTPSQGAGYDANPPNANNGDRTGRVGNTINTWTSSTPNNGPDWLQIEFSGPKTIDEIDVYTLQDNLSNPIEPTESTTFTTYGLTAFQVQYWDGTTWLPVPGGSVSGNDKVWKKFTFSPITTSKVKVVTNGSPDGYSRVIELEAWGPTAGNGTSGVRYVMQDIQGSTRAVMDGTSIVARHDYLPFGEEIGAGTGMRTPGQQFGAMDQNRMRYAMTERDEATGLDHTWFRKYETTSGRWTTPDPINGSIGDPQSVNRYSYVSNDPVNSIDPSGLMPCEPGTISADCDSSGFGGWGGGWNFNDRGHPGRNIVWARFSVDVRQVSRITVPWLFIETQGKEGSEPAWSSIYSLQFWLGYAPQNPAQTNPGTNSQQKDFNDCATNANREYRWRYLQTSGMAMAGGATIGLGMRIPAFGIPGTGGVGGLGSIVRGFARGSFDGPVHEGILGGAAGASVTLNGVLLSAHAIKEGQLNSDRRSAGIEDCKKRHPTANHSMSSLNF